MTGCRLLSSRGVVGVSSKKKKKKNTDISHTSCRPLECPSPHNGTNRRTDGRTTLPPDCRTCLVTVGSSQIIYDGGLPLPYNMIKTNQQGKIITDNLTLIPAYGRQPQTIKEATTSFLNGQDWELVHLGSSTYCSIRDFAPGTWVALRFRHLRSITHCKVPAELKPPTLDKTRELRHRNLLGPDRSYVVEALHNPPVTPDADKIAANYEAETRIT
jgi:hypothetical protein